MDAGGLPPPPTSLARSLAPSIACPSLWHSLSSLRYGSWWKSLISFISLLDLIYFFLPALLGSFAERWDYSNLSVGAAFTSAIVYLGIWKMFPSWVGKIDWLEYLQVEWRQSSLRFLRPIKSCTKKCCRSRGWVSGSKCCHFTSKSYQATAGSFCFRWWSLSRTVFPMLKSDLVVSIRPDVSCHCHLGSVGYPPRNREWHLLYHDLDGRFGIRKFERTHSVPNNTHIICGHCLCWLDTFTKRSCWQSRWFITHFSIRESGNC